MAKTSWSRKFAARKKPIDAVGIAVQGLILSLSVLKETADAIPPPAGTIVKGSLGGLLQIVDIVKTTIKNVDDINQLIDRVNTLERSIFRPLKGKETIPKSITDLVTDFARYLSSITDVLERIASRGKIIRLFYSREDAATIQDQMQEITVLIQNFLVEAVMSIRTEAHENVVGIRGDINGGREEVVQAFKDLGIHVDSSNFPRARKARFNCPDERNRHACLQGTREDLLATIYQWITQSSEAICEDYAITASDNRSSTVHVSPNRNRIFWLSGEAGTGKSTISQSIAEYCNEKSWLAASFFFSSDDGERSHPKLVISTIAHQLGTTFHPPLMPLMQEAVKTNPDIWYSDPSHQLQKLVIEPIRRSIAAGQAFPSPAVIVLDALDECKDDQATSFIVAVLSAYINQLPFSIFLTSRPEPKLHTPSIPPLLRSYTRLFFHHEISKSCVDDDIETFLYHELTQIGTRNEGFQKHDWFTKDNVRSLVQLSDGLFIFASTAVRFIESPDVLDPRGQLLELITTPRNPGHSKLHPYRHLDQLYVKVLRNAFPPSCRADTLARLRRILGCVVVLCDPLSARSISALLCHDTNKGFPVASILQRLRSIIIIPSDHASGPIRAMHASFSDFIVDHNRCTEPDFLIDNSLHHGCLAIDCLNELNSLSRDMCKIQDYSKLNCEISDLSRRIAQYIPQHIQYACRYWANHLAFSLPSDKLFDALKTFSFHRNLYWLEALSLMDSLDVAIPSLRCAKEVLSTFPGLPGHILDTLDDLERFVLEFFDPISVAALHIYRSGLPFTPLNSIIRAHFCQELEESFTVLNGTEQSWAASIIDGHSHSVNAIAFSLDGTHIASGSSDRTVRIWDTSSGTVTAVKTLEGHKDWIFAIAFSSDRTHIISGSSDRTVRIWDTSTGDTVKTLEGHKKAVYAVAFSPDGIHIVSGSADRTVRIWDTNTGTTVKTLEGHKNSVAGVAFSLDGMHILSGSLDRTVRIWDMSTSATVNILKGHSDWVRAIAFSPDCTLVVSGSEDHTIRIWNKGTGTTVKTLKGHQRSVTAVSFSPDGMSIISGSKDCTIRIWDRSTGTTIKTLGGHRKSVKAISLSPDGRYIVSGSEDCTVRMWDTRTGNTVKILESPKNWVRAVAFSTDGRRIVSGSDDHTVRILDSSTGTTVMALNGHSNCARAVAFSPDGMRVVSGSTDRTVRIWNVSTGTTIKALEGHEKGVIAVAFSPDGTQIASGSMDRTVRIWDTRTGDSVNTLVGHKDAVFSVAFSPGGTHVVSGSPDRTVCIWDTSTGVAKTLKGHKNWVVAVAFSLDGRHIVSGSLDRTVRIWDTSTGCTVKTLECYWSAVRGIALQGLYCDNDGWVFKSHGTHVTRLCRVPVSCWPECQDSYQSSLALGIRGRTVVLHFPPSQLAHLS